MMMDGNGMKNGMGSTGQKGGPKPGTKGLTGYGQPMKIKVTKADPRGGGGNMGGSKPKSNY